MFKTQFVLLYVNSHLFCIDFFFFYWLAHLPARGAERLPLGKSGSWWWEGHAVSSLKVFGLCLLSTLRSTKLVLFRCEMGSAEVDKHTPPSVSCSFKFPITLVNSANLAVSWRERIAEKSKGFPVDSAEIFLSSKWPSAAKSLRQILLCWEFQEALFSRRFAYLNVWLEIWHRILSWHAFFLSKKISR